MLSANQTDIFWELSNLPVGKLGSRLSFKLLLTEVERVGLDSEGISMLSPVNRTVVIKLWRKVGDKFKIPRELFSTDELKNLGYMVTTSCRSSRTPLPAHIVNSGERIRLRANQLLPYSATIKRKSGFLVLAPGKGKTVIALKVAAASGMNFAIFIHNGSLLTQWRDRAQEFLNCTDSDLGICKGHFSKWEFTKPITLIMLQSFYRQYIAGNIPKTFFNLFETVIWDEAHHLGAETFKVSVPLFAANRLALTATPTSTRMYKWLYAHIGNPIFVDDSQELVPICVGKGVEGLFKQYDHKNLKSYGLLLTESLGNKATEGSVTYLKAVGSEINKALIAGRKILIVSSRKNFPHRLKDVCGIDMAIIDGTVEFSKRMDVLKSRDVISVTPGVGSEGLDRADLDFLILAFPLGSNALNAFMQTAGRILRTHENKHKVPKIVIFYPNSPLGQRLINGNLMLARELGYRVKGFNSVRRVRKTQTKGIVPSHLKHR